MRFIVTLVFFLVFGANVQSQSNGIHWKSIQEVESLQKQEPRKVLIDVTAEWCGWCKIMDKKTFTDRDVFEYVNENFYAVKMDYDKTGPFKLNGKQYSPQVLAREQNISGLPALVFINEDYSLIIPSEGYKKPKQLLSELIAFNEN